MKTVTAELEVECETENEARAWAEKIVATLEDQEGKPIALAESMEFVAYSSPSDLFVEVIKD